MAERSAIEWTDATFNPWEGCQKVGPGCDNCYAENRNARFGGGVAVNWGPGAPRRRTSASNWAKPLQWEREHEAFASAHGRRRRVFCASLADVFDNEVPASWRADLFELIAKTPHLDWLLLTKRIGNVIGMLDETRNDAYLRVKYDLAGWVGAWQSGRGPANVWLGATVVNQAEADRDIPKLLAVPARVRFLSIEPMLGRIELGDCLKVRKHWKSADSLPSAPWAPPYPKHWYKPQAVVGAGWEPPLHWVIAGGESGPHARPAHPDWFRSLRDQCAAAGVPFLFKQWGEWAEHDAGPPPHALLSMDTETGRVIASACDGFISLAGEFVHDMEDASTDEPYRGMQRIGKKAAGRLLDSSEHNGFPEVARA